MKTESTILIADVRKTLRRVVDEASDQNVLLAALAEWLFNKQSTPALVAAAAKAANAKGGERSSLAVAVLGFSNAIGPRSESSTTSFDQHLNWLIGRPNFGTGGEPSNVLVDPAIFLGVIVGAYATLDKTKLKNFDAWARCACKDAFGISGDSGWQRGLLQILGQTIGATDLPTGNPPPSWLRAALSGRSLAVIKETEVTDVLKEGLAGTTEVSEPFEAVFRLAAIKWATERAMDFDLGAMTIADVARVLENLSTVFLRWVWEEKPRTSRRGALPRKWHIVNEYHVQSLVHTALKPIFPSLEEEKYLAATGTYQPRADLCISALQLVIELKYWYRGDKAKDLIEQIAADLSLYLRPDSPYRQVIAVIWDEAARTEEHPELKRGLAGLSGMAQVIMLSRPSVMESDTVAKTKIIPRNSKKS
jgi:hypothetical protein